VHRAIGREKHLKGWRGLKKIALVVAANPTWRNLSQPWYERHEFEPEVVLRLRRIIRNRMIQLRSG